MEKNKFINKVVVITGATKGIGLSMAQMFANEGAKVYALSRRPIIFTNKNISHYSIDVSDEESCKKFASFLESKEGRIDVLINNAGCVLDKTTKKMELSDFNKTMNVNLVGTFLLTKYLIPLFLKNKTGNIINFSSVVGSKGNVGQANYAATKAGVEAMAKCWAKELTLHGETIRVNTIAPGPVDTEMFLNVSEELKNKFAQKTLLNRFAKPEEIAKVAIFLASDDASYITGTTIFVDGGYSIK